MANSKHVTLQEIADSLGAPLEQVTKVILGQPGIDEAFRQKVFSALEAAGIVRLSRGTQAGTIGVVIPGTLFGDYIGEVVHSITEATKARGFSLILNVENDSREEDLIRLLGPGGCDGVIAIVPNHYNRLLELCYQFKREPVLVDYQGDDDLTSAMTVEVRNHDGIFQLMHYLFELGHRRIGFITGRMAYASARQRLQGYVDAMAAAGLPEMVVEGDWSHSTGYEAARQLFALNPLPTAIVASNDLMAFGAMQAAREAGLRVGNDVSITGVDDIKLAATVSPSLTTLRQPMAQMGEAAADMIIRRIKGEPLAEQHILFDTELIVRESTGVAPA